MTRLFEEQVEACRICPRLPDFNDAMGGKGVSAGNVPARYFVVGQNIGSRRSEGGVAPFDYEKFDEMVALFVDGQRYGHTILPAALAEVGWPIDQTYFSNVLKCSTPENREATAMELWHCGTNWLLEELRECQPDVIIALGMLAFNNMNIVVHGTIPVRRVLHHSYICFRKPVRYDEWLDQWRGILKEFQP